jgi:hypothetical protein
LSAKTATTRQEKPAGVTTGGLLLFAIKGPRAYGASAKRGDGVDGKARRDFLHLPREINDLIPECYDRAVLLRVTDGEARKHRAVINQHSMPRSMSPTASKKGFGIQRSFHFSLGHLALLQKIAMISSASDAIRSSDGSSLPITDGCLSAKAFARRPTIDSAASVTKDEYRLGSVELNIPPSDAAP